jgi:hydroxymethylbilane synthase
VLRIGTRGSALALTQARGVAEAIGDAELVPIRTSGDEGGAAAAPVEDKSRFVREIERALLEGEIELAVHSAKDLPGLLPDGLIIAAALEREDPRDALLLRGSSVNSFDTARATLGLTPRLGTSSVRRAAELRGAFPRATFVPIRGNVDTRVRKLDAGDCDALVLAAAGVKRLGLEQRLSAFIPTEICMPAPGQGIVAIEIAEGADAGVRDAVARISDADAETALLAERAVVQALGGGCQMPLGALTTIDGQDISVDGVVASPDGATVLRAVARGHRSGPAAVGEKLAAQLVARGASQFLR